MHFLAIQFGLSGPSQPELVSCLRGLGAKSIQTAQGLCVKSPLAERELAEAIEQKGLRGAKIGPLPEPLPGDVRAFMERES